MNKSATSANQSIQQGQGIVQWIGPLPEGADLLADFLLGLAVIVRIAGGTDLMNVFSKDQTIQVLREVAKRLRDYEQQQRQYHVYQELQNKISNKSMPVAPQSYGDDPNSYKYGEWKL